MSGYAFLQLIDPVKLLLNLAKEELPTDSQTTNTLNNNQNLASSGA